VTPAPTTFPARTCGSLPAGGKDPPVPLGELLEDRVPDPFVFSSRPPLPYFRQLISRLLPVFEWLRETRAKTFFKESAPPCTNSRTSSDPIANSRM
jgi:hypothetical protein